MHVTCNDLLKLFTSVWKAVYHLVNHRGGQEHQVFFLYLFFRVKRPICAPLTSKHQCDSPKTSFDNITFWKQSDSPQTSFDNITFWKQSQFMKFLPRPQQLAQSTYHVILPHQSAAAAVNGTALSTGMLKQPFKWGKKNPTKQAFFQSFTFWRFFYISNISVI